MGYISEKELKRSLNDHLLDERIVGFSVLHSDAALITARVTTDMGRTFIAKWIMVDKEWKRVEPQGS
jgi:hypothetical protein